MTTREKLSQGQSFRSIGVELQIQPCQLHPGRCLKDDLRKSTKGANVVTPHASPPSSLNHIEDDLLQYYQEVRSQGMAVSYKMLMAKACELESWFRERPKYIQIRMIRRFMKSRGIALPWIPWDPPVRAAESLAAWSSVDDHNMERVVDTDHISTSDNINNSLINHDNNKPTVRELCHQYTKDAMMAFLCNINMYEHSNWVVQDLVAQQCSTSTTTATMPSSLIDTIADLALAMKQVVDAASRKRKMVLLREYPDLCVCLQSSLLSSASSAAASAAVQSLSLESQEEVSALRFHTWTEEDRDTFQKLHAQYHEKFTFPLIISCHSNAVTTTKYTILATLEARLHNTLPVEFATALAHVHQLAWRRLISKINIMDSPGSLSCHVLDTVHQCPGEFCFAVFWWCTPVAL